MRSKPLKTLFKTVGLLLMLATNTARADGWPMQLHARTGVLNAMIGGAKGVDSFMAMPILDTDFEFLTSAKKTHVARFTFANDLSSAQTKYLFAGYGRRYYVWGTSSTRMNVNDAAGSVQSVSNRRYYYGWDVGYGQLQAEQVGLSLNITSTVFEASAAAGMIHQISNDWGLGLHMSMGYAYGFSSVAVTGIMVRALVGATYYF